MNTSRMYTPCEASILAGYNGSEYFLGDSVSATLPGCNDVEYFLSGSVNTAPRSTVLAGSQLEQVSVLINEIIKRDLGSATFKSESYREQARINHGFGCKVKKIPLPTEKYSFSDGTPCYEALVNLAGTTQDVTEFEAAVWYAKFKSYAVDRRTMEALDLLFGYVEDAFDVPDFQKLEFMLRQIEPAALSAEMLISVLRSTSRAKKVLPTWGRLLSAAKEKLGEERLPARLLRGL